jgi:glycerol-3-phosphate dehydrogenase (NAD+)
VPDFDSSSKRPILISGAISKAMGNNFRCGVLMGANVANEVAKGQLCESTLACSFTPPLDEITRLIFHSPETFRVQQIRDVAGAEVCGALKNVIALGAGFLDGLGLGNNTKAALIRIGLHKTLKFRNAFFQGVSSDTLLQSCGVADLITTCYSGKHQCCAEEFAKAALQREEEDKDKESMKNGTLGISITKSRDARRREACEAIWENIQSNLLNGQKLQGTLCAKEVYAAISSINAIEKYPLLTTIHDIAFSGKPVQDILKGIKDPSSTDLKSFHYYVMQSNL